MNNSLDNTELNETKEQNTASFSLKSEIFDWFDSIIFCIVTVILLFTFIFRIVGVSGPSMMQTLQDKDRLIISRLFYTPKQGDIIVETKPNTRGEPYIKRIIALGGQTIDIDPSNGTVIIDGEVLKEDYINEKQFTNGNIQYPFTVPENEVFVMGDNRNHSLDSRDSSVGTIHENYILGKAYFRLLPFDTFGPLK